MTQRIQWILQPICRAQAWTRAGIAAALVLMLISPVLYGQFITGSISGTVRDPSGAVVPRANVTLINRGHKRQPRHRHQ